MKTYSIVEGNAIIGKFMGQNLTDPINYMFYHNDWNELMKVVEKINFNREVNEVSIRPGRTKIWLSSGSFIESPLLPQNTSIIECWTACVEFIEWYNTKNPDQ